MKAKQLISGLITLKNQTQALFAQKFFRTRKGEYAEGDLFLGIKVPQVRKKAMPFCALPLSEIEILIKSKWHEVRLAALVILVSKFKKAEQRERAEIIQFYLKHLDFINNWDLVDVSCYNLLGAFLVKEKDRKVLYDLASSKSLWRERIAIVSTLAFIKQNQFEDTLRLSKSFLRHPHDLIHKACGWMLREVGKRDKQKLLTFLSTHARVMPSVMFSYAIEKLTLKEKRVFKKMRS